MKDCARYREETEEGQGGVKDCDGAGSNRKARNQASEDCLDMHRNMIVRRNILI